MASRTSRNVVAANDTRRRRFAPDIPEVSQRRMVPPVTATAEQMAQQLADDPEFRAWAGAELRARWAGR